MSEESNIAEVIKATEGLVKAVPVYDDLVKPAAREVGQSLETIAKTINLILSPLRATIWGYEQITGFVETAVSARLKNLPESRIVHPNPIIAGPALEALRFTGCDTTLRELYANLLASTLDSKTAKNCSPAFAKVLEQFTPDEAKILNVASFDLSYASFIIPFISLDKKIKGINARVLEPFTTIQFEANCDFPDFIDVYIDNLKTIGRH